MTNAQFNANIHFSTNAAQVARQIDDIVKKTTTLNRQAKFARALDTNKASARELTGQISGRKAIVRLEQDITKEAERRMKSIVKDYRFGNQQQNQFVRGLVHQNEVMRIQHKIMTDNATAMVNLGKNTQWAGRQLVVGFTVPLTIAAGAAMKAFSDLEKEMVRFKRVYGDVTTSGDDLKAVSKQVRNLANEWTKYGVAVSDTITLAADAAGAGFTGNQLISQIDSATKLAVLGELEKQKAMKATIALQSTFKMSNEELGQSINYLNQLENSTMVTMDDMATAIPKAATVVQGLGGDIKDLGTFMAALQEGGVKAAEGANALKSGLGSLLNPSKKAVEQLAAVGVNMETLWTRSEENGRGVISVVEELGAALDTLGQTQKQRVIEEVFGKHQFARMNALLSNINKGTQASQAKGVGASSQLESALIAQQELGKLGESTLTKFQSSIEKLKASIAPLGEQIMKFVTPLVEFATKMVEKFNNMPDVFKKIALGLVAGTGVIAPLFLMLLGQIQNLLGNGMKLIAWTKSWGKNVEWVAIENLTLADALGGVNAKLIAENALLTANAGAWTTRNTAANAAGTAPLVTGRRSLGSKLKRFASGGNVPGSGNGDTVPALLTPGEFVVRKGIASKFGGVLHAMNSGKFRGYAGGGPVLSNRQVAMSRQESAESAIGNSKTAQAIKDLIETSRKNIMAFKSAEGSFIDRQVKKNKFVQDNRYSQWDQSHVGFADARYLSQLSEDDARKAMLRGGIPPQMIKTLNTVNKPWNYKGDIIMDNHLINTALPGAADHPLTTTEVKKVQTVATKRRLAGNDTARNTMTEIIARWRSSGAGRRFYQSLLDDNFIFMNMIGKTLQKGGKQVKLGKTPFGLNKRMQKFATGGFVPGEGNKDTVPALLTPGEAVVKKSAATKFAPILNAMNSGKLGMFGDGYTKGINKFGGTPLSGEMRAGFMDPFRAAIDSIVMEMTRTLGLGADEIKELRSQLERDYNGAPDASHVVREEDAEGNKIWRNENLVAASKQENVTFEAIAKSQTNMDALAASSQRLGGDIEKRRKVLQRVSEGEHLVDKQSRLLLKEMMEETLQYEKSNPNLVSSKRLTENVGGLKGAAFAGGMSVVPINYATQEKMTKAEVKALRKEAKANGTGKAPKTTVDPGYDDNIKTGRGRFDPYALMMMVSMFGGEISGATEKLGKFGDALNMALPALMTMQMMGMSPNLNMKGMIGKGAAAGKVGLAAKYAKFGLGAAAGFGTIGAIGGGLIGNKISDGSGGSRDAAGSAVSWGATGAGLGMMIGPWGAAIGAAVGALAGFTVATMKNSKEQDRLTDAMTNVAGRWETIGETLEKQFQIGGAEGIAGLLDGVAKSNEQQKELYTTMKEQMTTDATWQKSITDIVTANQKGVLQPGQIKAEIDTATMQFRGQGVDEESIRTIVQAYIDSIPAEVRQGYSAATVEIATTEAIVTGLQASVNALTGELKTLESGGSTGGYGNWKMPSSNYNYSYIGAPQSITTSTMEFDPQESGRLAGELVATIASLNNSLAEAEVNSKEWDEAVQNLTDAQQANLALQGKVEGEEARKAMGRAAGARVSNLIATNQGLGLVGDDWNKTIEDFKGNSVDLAIAAEQLILAGYNIQGWSPEQMFAGAALAVQGAAYKQGYNKAQESLKQGEADLVALENARQTRDDQLTSRADEIALDKRDVELGKVEAELEVSRINIESGALSVFVGKFNKAFGTAIDSFADAQYQIDKIGAKIQSIQLKVIGPIQERADDLRRLNDLDARKIDKLQKKAQAWDEAHQKRLDKLTKAYDEQAAALDRVRKQNEYIADQQRANISLADALSKGDLAGAANAMVDSAQNQQKYAATLQDTQLADARDAALSKEQDKKNPYEGRIDKIQAGIDARSQKILALEDRIYRITEKQIEPLQRKQDLMSLMLSNTQREMEYQKANADGIDQENQARERALINAQLANVEAQNRLTIEQNIRKEYRDSVRDIKERYKVESSNYAKIHAAIDTSNEKQKTSMEYLSTAIDKNAQNMAIVLRGGKEFDKFFAQNKPLLGSTADVLTTAMEYVRTGDVPSPSKTKNVTFDSPSREAAQANANRKFGGGGVNGTGGQDSVPTMLTPGEFVIRRSIAKKLGRKTLERINMGDPGIDPSIDTGGATKMAKGGAVPNFLGTFGDSVAGKLAGEPQFASAKSSSNGQNVNWTPSSSAGRAGLATAMERYLGSTHIDGEAVARMCARNVGKIWRKVVGVPTYAGSPTAASVAYKVRDSGRMNSGVGPRGSIAYWNSSIGGGAGHVAINDGRGNTLNNWGGSTIQRTPISNQKTGYMGWSNTFNKGGIVPGFGNTDKVPAWLTPGEMVLRKGAVNNIGRGPLKALNETGRLESNTVSLTPQRQAAPMAAGDVVYNYDVAFAISGVNDPNEVADIVIRKFERATKGKIRSR